MITLQNAQTGGVQILTKHWKQPKHNDVPSATTLNDVIKISLKHDISLVSVSIPIAMHSVCWWRKSVDICDRPMHGHVLYRGPGPSLMTGVLLWLVCGSGTVYWLHCVTLTVFAASESSWRRFCLVAAAAHSDYVFFVLQILLLSYLLTYFSLGLVLQLELCYTVFQNNCTTAAMQNKTGNNT